MATTAHAIRSPGIGTKVRPWVDLQELPKHLANILPYLLGTAIAYWQSGQVDWAVLGVALPALGTAYLGAAVTGR